jgi:hypothetical protein
MEKTIEQRTRAYRTLDFIEAHPDKHDQAFWIYREAISQPITLDLDLAVTECGTTACFAGWTVLLAGQQISARRTAMDRFGIPERAEGLLGLTIEEADELFWQADDLADVRKAVFEIFGPRPDGAL